MHKCVNAGEFQYTGTKCLGCGVEFSTSKQWKAFHNGKCLKQTAERMGINTSTHDASITDAIRLSLLILSMIGEFAVIQPNNKQAGAIWAERFMERVWTLRKHDKCGCPQTFDEFFSEADKHHEWLKNKNEGGGK